MNFNPSDRPHDPMDGRDKKIHAAFGTESLLPTYNLNNGASVDTGRVPYDDLQPSPSPCIGTFDALVDQGELTVMSRGYTIHRPLARIILRQDVTQGVMVSLAGPLEEDV